ncbi:protocadherin beta-15 isoform X1 [Octopus bimaculoides]|uniref:Cadherin domain-containing protein n=1 Tax=Octopus bimaculoides TaxID=37653 RepID=A0A0L8G6R2_OCTBM|nr:protocadherin beta-15 isoform X1 [Octopus bimaculoides]XP_014783555.1 protocadherin beta-15 isoform X1 [Octopus bimaculoides]|eukprot:XP_014783554.1 PREDICTED: protocadherin beta-15-like isoform X1 [Octopus bimaculoides]
MFAQICVVFALLHTSKCVDFTFYVKEGRRPNTFIGDVSMKMQLMDSVPATDISSTWFSLLQHDTASDHQLFNISRNGKLFTARTLDAESLCKYNTDCYKTLDVAVQKQKTFLKILEIRVIIQDVNDHTPIFSEKQVDIEFSERDSKGSSISIPNAIDEDVGVLNSQITYQLKKHSNEPFMLSESKKVDGTAKLGIILEEKLNREVKDTYHVQVIAKDGGTPTKQSVLNVQIFVTDVNDNSPVFNQDIYNVSIKSSHRKNIPVVVVSAKDLDAGKNGRILYTFSSKSSDTSNIPFELNKLTGELFLHENFTPVKKQTYKLFIEAKDEGMPPLSSTTMVILTINDQMNIAPKIDVSFVSASSKNAAAISEETEIGSFVAFVKVTDNDIGPNGEVSCELHHDKFRLQSLGGKKYKLTIKSLVDRETERQIDITITCQDRGLPPLQTKTNVSIQVMDINDVKPQFSKDTFRFLIYENEKPNFPVGLINATDPDLDSGGQLSYSLFANNKNKLPFSITDFGFISTTQTLDRELQSVYRFKVLVKDNGTPSLNNTANIMVEVMDENDNAPYFIFPQVNPFRLDVHYHPRNKNNITVLRASDKDNQENAFLRYGILEGNDRQLFTINTYTGAVSFSRVIFQRDAGAYNIVFVVRDSGTPVLSATTTLSLTLSVSNKTATMLTALDTEPTDRIHINLVIIIVLAAVTVSVVMVISITICILRRNNERHTEFCAEIDPSNKILNESNQLKYFCEKLTPQSDPSIAIVDVSKSRSHMPIRPSEELPSRYETNHNRLEAPLGIPCQDTSEMTQQMSVKKTAGISGSLKDRKTAVNSPYRSSEMSTVSCADGRHGWSEGDTGYYEELPDVYSCKFQHLQNVDKDSFVQTLNYPSDISSRHVYHPSIKKNLHSNEMGTHSINTTTQPWNLPMRNSFTSYTKPLPAVPKLPYS